MAKDTLRVNEQLYHSSVKFWGGMLATFLTMTLSYALGLEIEEILGAVVIGFTLAKAFVTKVLPKILKKFRPANTQMQDAIDKQDILNENSMQYGEKLGHTISGKVRSILIISAITYAVSHYIAPILIQLATSPTTASIISLVAALIPGLQIAAVSIFIITAVYIVYERTKAYKTQSKEQAAALLDSDVSLSADKIEITAQKETLAGLFGIVVMNAALAAFQISTIVFGSGVVTPIAAICLGSFIAAFTLFYLVPKGTYSIVLSLKKTDVSKLKSHTTSPEPKEKSTLEISPKSVNKAMALAISGMIAHHSVKMLFSLPFIQHMAIIATGFVTASAIILVAIPRIINKRRLNHFKQSNLFHTISNRLEESKPAVTNNNRETLIQSVALLYETRPDIVVATLILSDESKSTETMIIKHGFIGVALYIDKFSDDLLENIMSQADLKESTSLQGPYFVKPTQTLVLNHSAPRAKPNKKEAPPIVIADEAPRPPSPS